MIITINPVTLDSTDEFKLALFKNDRVEYREPVTYWGIYLNSEQISYTSTKELAEKTKTWMENWLKGKP